MILVLSACGGGDDDTGVPTVSLTVVLKDFLSGTAPSGHQVEITDEDDIRFTCFQSPSQNIKSDLRCDTEAAGNDQDGGSSTLIFSSLPTGRRYTLNAATALAGDGTSIETCTVEIQSTTELSATVPCVKIGTNSIRFDINTPPP